MKRFVLVVGAAVMVSSASLTCSPSLAADIAVTLVPSGNAAVDTLANTYEAVAASAFAKAQQAGLSGPDAEAAIVTALSSSIQASVANGSTSAQISLALVAVAQADKQSPTITSAIVAIQKQLATLLQAGTGSATGGTGAGGNGGFGNGAANAVGGGGSGYRPR